jgi:CheY-like chemotaxis protein
MLLNLCLNSRDAMPNGGQLIIATESYSASESFCQSHSWAKPGRYALISVSDTGEGMSQKVRDRIFEPFFTTKEVGKGSGLGLSMAYGTIHQHDGEILVSSEPGIGTTFKVFLPSQVEVEAVAEQSGDVEISGGNETILVAEDEEAVLFLTSALLEHKGYTVVTATNGVEALEIIDSNKNIDLVLLDVVMPKMGGWEVFEKIKEIRPSIPVLFSTGYAANAIDREFLSKNGVSLISKPFAPEELYLTVRHSLDKA